MTLRPEFPSRPVEQADALEHLRQGSVEQYESNWVEIKAGASKEFEHGLDEVPRVVEVEESEVSDGNFAKQSRVSSDLTTTATIDPSDLADGAGETHSVTFTGARLGDFVLVAAPYDLQDLIVTAYVSASDTVEVRIQNENAGANVNLASGTWRFRIIKPNDVTCAIEDSSATSGSGKDKVTVKNNTTADKFYKVRAL